MIRLPKRLLARAIARNVSLPKRLRRPAPWPSPLPDSARYPAESFLRAPYGFLQSRGPGYLPGDETHEACCVLPVECLLPDLRPTPVPEWHRDATTTPLSGDPSTTQLHRTPVL